MFVESCSAVKALVFLHAAGGSDVVAVSLRCSPPFSPFLFFSLFSKGLTGFARLQTCGGHPKPSHQVYMHRVGRHSHTDLEGVKESL